MTARPVCVRCGGTEGLDRPSHTDAIADTGDGYTVRRGWHISCLWCEWQASAGTKREAEAMYREHERITLAAEASAAEAVDLATRRSTQATQTAPVDWAARLRATADELRRAAAAYQEDLAYPHIASAEWTIAEGESIGILAGRLRVADAGTPSAAALIAMWGPDMAGWVADALEAEADRGVVWGHLTDEEPDGWTPAPWAMHIADRILGDTA